MLAYRTIGSGTPCVFLHGFLESSSMWKYIPLVSLEQQSVLVDLPGHGASPISDKVSESQSIASMADEVIELIEHLGIHEFNIIGHSMGGYVALEVKNKRPSCKKVILLNSNYWEDAEQKKRDRKRIAILAFEAKRFFIQKAIPSLFLSPDNYQGEGSSLLEEALRVDSEAIAISSLAMAARKNWTSLLPKEDFYLIHGAQDRLVSLDQIDDLVIDSAHFFIIKSGGHMSHIEAPEEVMLALNAIFTKD